jgi:hypothetical protein
MPLIHTPISSTLVSAVRFAGDRRPLAITAIRSQISNNSSNSSEITRIAVPAVRRSISACRMKAAAPTSTPQVGCATTRSFGCCRISRPMMNFCRLPPDSDFAWALGPPHLTSYLEMHSKANTSTAAKSINPLHQVLGAR